MPRFISRAPWVRLCGVLAAAALCSRLAVGAPLTLEQALATALEQNPQLASQAALVEAAGQRPSQAGALPDPVITIGAVSVPTDTFEFDQEAMTQLQLGFSQALPFPGKRELRRREAAVKAEAADLELAEARLMVARDVRTAWWRLFYLDRALERVAENQAQLRELVRFAESRYRVGQGSQQDVLTAQVELSGQLIQEVTLHGQRRAEEARLRALMRLGEEVPLELPTALPQTLPAPPEDSAALRQKALGDRALLGAARQERLAARTRLAQAERDRYPDFNVQLTYGVRQGENPDGGRRADLATLVLGVTVPLWFDEKQGPAIEQRAAELRAAEATIDRRVEQVNAEISEALAEQAQATEQANLLEAGVIPQTRQALAALLAGYQVSQSDFDKLLRTQLLLNNYEIQYWKAVTDAWRAQAQLLAAVGLEENP